MNIDARTRLYMLIGKPVDHSLSPILHNAAFRALGLNSVYLAASVEPDSIGNVMKAMRALSIAGANITSPHKEAVIEFLDDVTKEAEVLKSVNTIVNNKGILQGISTDGEGFYRALSNEVDNYDPEWPVMVVGAGGAARAVAYKLCQKGAGEIFLVNRSAEKAKALAELLIVNTDIKRCHVIALEAEKLKAAIVKSRVIIYSLPVDSSDFIAALSDLGPVQKNRFLFDLRYDPKVTDIMKIFEKSRGRAYNGIEMLFWQAVEAFKYFTGQQAPVDNMRSAMERYTGM